MGCLELDCHSSVKCLRGAIAHSPICVTQPPLCDTAFFWTDIQSFITCSESNRALVLSRDRNAILSIVCCRIGEISSTYGNCAGVNTPKEESSARQVLEGSAWCEELDCREAAVWGSSYRERNKLISQIEKNMPDLLVGLVFCFVWLHHYHKKFSAAWIIPAQLHSVLSQSKSRGGTINCA